MKIGIDARMYGLEHAGIGRYIKNLVDRIVNHSKYNYVLFTTSKYEDAFPKNKNITVVSVDVPHYSLEEQIRLPSIFYKHHLTLLHVPHFNVPFTYNEPFITTIHDILWHQVKGSQVTTLSPLKYYLKYAGYRLVTRNAVSKSKAIIVPSKWVKKQLIKQYSHLKPNKIHVTYEAVDDAFTTAQKTSKKDSKPYVVYVGSAYPHKNIKTMLEAVNIVRKKYNTKLEAHIISSRSVFLNKLKKTIRSQKATSYVHCLGFLSDHALQNELQNSIALIHPSLSEGFGLTGLEAMMAKTAVISSDHGSLPEIYQDAVLYANPDKPEEFAQHIHTLIRHDSTRNKLINHAFKHAKNFSWDQTTLETLNIYKKVIGSLK